MDQQEFDFDLTYFEGFPFDIAFYSDADRSITIKNTRNEISQVYTVESGVNRLFISDGVNSITTLNQIPLSIGINPLEFWIGTTLIFTINLEKKDVECGKYLRWFNKNGAYSYFLITTNYTTSTSSRTLATLEEREENMDQSSGNFFITGKDSSQSKQFLTQLLNRSQFTLLENIFRSPKVQLLNKDRLTEVKEIDWLNVSVKDGSINDESKRSSQRLPIIINMPKPYNQTL